MTAATWIMVLVLNGQIVWGPTYFDGVQCHTNAGIMRGQIKGVTQAFCIPGAKG